MVRWNEYHLKSCPNNKIEYSSHLSKYLASKQTAKRTTHTISLKVRIICRTWEVTCNPHRTYIFHELNSNSPNSLRIWIIGFPKQDNEQIHKKKSNRLKSKPIVWNNRRKSKIQKENQNSKWINLNYLQILELLKSKNPLINLLSALSLRHNVCKSRKSNAT